MVATAHLLGRSHEAGAAPFRYEIMTTTTIHPAAVRVLERAFSRLGLGGDRCIQGADVSTSGGCILVAFDLSRGGRRSVRSAEDAFAAAWYDAFGEPAPPHTGTSWRSSGPCATPPPG